MPFAKGNQLGKANKGRRRESPKTVWILQSLMEHGFDYEAVLVKFLNKAATGDRHALDMAHVLIKLVPHLANAPKNDAGVTQIETLVINRFDGAKALESNARPVVDEPTETTVVDEPSKNGRLSIPA